LFAVVLIAAFAATGCARTKTLTRVKDLSLHVQAFPAVPKIEAISQNTVADIQATETPDKPLGAPHIANVTTMVALKNPATDAQRAFLENLPEISVSFDDAARTVRLFYREKVSEQPQNKFMYTLRSPLPFFHLEKGREKSGVAVLPAPSLYNKDSSFTAHVVSVGDEGDAKVLQGANGQRTTVTWYARETGPWCIVYQIGHP
jgi:hypothetical protein